MIVYTNEAAVATYAQQRRQHQHTYIITRPYADTFFGNLTEYTTEVLLSSAWKQCTFDRRYRLENALPNYSIITLNKIAFLQEVVTYDPYGSEYFIWVDAGLGRFDPALKYAAWPDVIALRRYDVEGNQVLVQGAVPSSMGERLKTRARARADSDALTHPLDTDGKTGGMSLIATLLQVQ